MSNNCGCDHCDCNDEEKSIKSAEEKVDNLKKDIAGLGYKLEETPEGDIKISE